MSIIKLSSDALTTAVAGQVEYDGKVFYGTPQSTERGIIPGQQYYRLLNAVAGANVATAQSTFGVGVNLSASTVYAFDSVVALSKSAGTTSHNISILFGGTATLNNISYLALHYYSTVSQTENAATTPGRQYFVSVATATTLIVGSTSATAFFNVRMTGTVSINAAGTFIPQYILSAAPGGAYTTAAGSYFAIYPIGTAGSNVSVGTWA